jgi:hypothetical protein
MGQGEGREIIEERIFIGAAILADKSAPIISHQRVDEQTKGEVVVKARIHDNKSPDMPQDWGPVVLLIDDEVIPLQWYGEYLWKTTVHDKSKSAHWQICATDYAGNKVCKTIQFE